MKRDQRGFTLMELMIVIVIIGVLAAIGVPAYKNYVTESKNNACAANKRTIETACRWIIWRQVMTGTWLHTSKDPGAGVGNKSRCNPTWPM